MGFPVTNPISLSGKVVDLQDKSSAKKRAER
jgi:hypothetical protein